MRTSAFFAAAAAAAMLAGCGLGAPDYPTFGQAAYRLEGQTAGPNGGPATRTVIYRDGPKMRVEAVLPGMGEATIVFDESTNAAYVLNPTAASAVTPPAQPAATTTPAPTQTTPVDPAATPSAAPPPTAVAPTAPAGVAVRIDDTTAPKPLEDAWAALGPDNARSEGECEAAGEQGNLWRPRETAGGVERVACITDDGVVLRINEGDAVLWEATALQRGAQDAALFGVPPGYQLIDPQAVADQVGQSMEHLDSVTGANPPTN